MREIVPVILQFWPSVLALVKAQKFTKQALTTSVLNTAFVPCKIIVNCCLAYWQTLTISWGGCFIVSYSYKAMTKFVNGVTVLYIWAQSMFWQSLPPWLNAMAAPKCQAQRAKTKTKRSISTPSKTPGVCEYFQGEPDSYVRNFLLTA